MNKNILILSFVFPPYPGIGGRRWAKFSKYLERNGNKVHVICAENPFSTQSEWNKDIKNLAVHRLPLNYPKALITFPGGLAGKISYRLALLKVKLLGKGNFYDRALFWEKQLLEKAGALIREHGIRNVIVSGAPFHLMYHACKLRQDFPGINLIADFRDYWTEDHSLFPAASLSAERIAEEQRREGEVLKSADKVIAVAEAMTQHFASLSKPGKCHTIINGFDEDDFAFLENETRTPPAKKTFVFTGNLYNNIENTFVPFCDALLRLKTTHPDKYNSLDFQFIGTSSVRQKQVVKERQLECISFRSQVSLEETMRSIHNADYCMLFLNDVYAFSLSTKFCEYIGLGKKIILFSNKGPASDFITRNNIGSWIDPEKCYEDLLGILSVNAGTENYSPVFDRSKFSVKEITKELEQLLV